MLSKLRYIWSDSHPYHCDPTGEVCGYCREYVGGYSVLDKVVWTLRRDLSTDSDGTHDLRTDGGTTATESGVCPCCGTAFNSGDYRCDGELPSGKRCGKDLVDVGVAH